MIRVFDEFTDPDNTPIQDHTPNIDVKGGGWSILHGGVQSIQSNRLFIPGATNWSSAINPGVADLYIITGQVIDEHVNGFRARILFRAIDINNWLAFEIDGRVSTSGKRSITQRIAGVETVLSSRTPAPTGPGTYQFKVTVSGISIACEDVTSEISVAASTGQFQLKQLCGLGNTEEVAGVFFDNFQIETFTIPTETEKAASSVDGCSDDEDKGWA